MAPAHDTRTYLDLYLLSRAEFLAKYPHLNENQYRGIAYRAGLSIPDHEAAITARDAGGRMEPMPAKLVAKVVGKKTEAATPTSRSEDRSHSLGSRVVSDVTATASGLRPHMVGELSAEAEASHPTTEAVEGVYPTPTVPSPKTPMENHVVQHGDTGSEESLSHSETALLHLSDVHFGAKTPSFDPEICLARLESLGKRMIEIRNHLSGTPIDGLTVLMLGDMVEGEGIYSTQHTHVAISSAEEQAQRLADFMAPWLVKLQDVYGPVQVHTTCGNHGRTGKDRNEFSNFDRIFYTYLKLRLTGTGITVSIPDRDPFTQVVEIHGWRFLLHHGNYIKAGGVTPQGSIVNRVLRWNTTREFGNIDIFTHGHYHQIGYTEINGIPIFSNGTMKELDSFALGFMGWESSLRTFFHGTSALRKVTWCYPMALNETD